MKDDSFITFFLNSSTISIEKKELEILVQNALLSALPPSAD